MAITPHRKLAKSKELRMYEALLPRKNISVHDKNHYENLRKGHVGEMKFAETLHSHPSDSRLALFDFLLESNQTEFQIDSLIITAQTIYLLEVKFFEGDFYIENDKWYVVGSRKEIRNPLLQIQRSEFLFKQILRKLQINLPVKPYVIFNNDNFTLYQTPLGLPIVFPTQLNRFVRKLNSSAGRLTNHHRKIAERLASLQLVESKNMRLPEYEFAELRKGIVCSRCQDLYKLKSHNWLICAKCDSKERIEDAVIRSVAEFNFLFHDKRITTSIISEWCSEIVSKSQVRRILLKNMKLMPRARYSYYIFEDSIKNHRV